MTQKLMLRCLLVVVGLLLTVCRCVSAQESAIVDVPEVIQAGEVLNFTIRLDKAPNFDGGVVQFSVVGPDTQIGTSTSPLIAGQKECHAAIQIPAAATGGQWHLRINGFFTGPNSFHLNPQIRRSKLKPRKIWSSQAALKCGLTPRKFNYSEPLRLDFNFKCKSSKPRSRRTNLLQQALSQPSSAQTLGVLLRLSMLRSLRFTIWRALRNSPSRNKFSS